MRFPDGAKTAADAAAAIGVDVGQIVKSLIFAVDGDVVLAYVSGVNQLDETKLAAAAGGTACTRVDADTVRAATGFPIGGVPPFGHSTELAVFVDPDLLRTTRCGRPPARGTTCSPSPRPTSCGSAAGTVTDLASLRGSSMTDVDRPFRVLDLTTTLAGAYCGHLLSSGGVDVVRAEPPGGHPLRAWSASGATIPADGVGPAVPVAGRRAAQRDRRSGRRRRRRRAAGVGGDDRRRAVVAGRASSTSSGSRRPRPTSRSRRSRRSG